MTKPTLREVEPGWSDPLTVQELGRVLADEEWEGRWNPQDYLNSLPLAEHTARVLIEAGYDVFKRAHIDGSPRSEQPDYEPGEPRWEPNCGQCHACDVHHASPSIGDGFNGRFIVCATCGNKRCPHATDHRLACTGSNAANQPGSNYQVAYFGDEPGAPVSQSDGGGV